MPKLGLIVNPIAGMGGTVGLKGTDTETILKEAIRRGARPVSSERTREFVTSTVKANTGAKILVAAAPMGKDITDKLGVPTITIGRVGSETTREDTVRIARAMLREKPSIIVFVGGDGTARDILESVGDKAVTLGVPAGVKVFSSVFSINPITAALTVSQYLRGELETRRGEVLDVDEELYRKGHLAIKLEGYLVTPDAGRQMQNPKSPSETNDEHEMDTIAEYLKEEVIHADDIYVLGPGITMDRIARRIGMNRKTLLGVDVVRGDGRVIVLDAGEREIIEAVQDGKTHIILSPIGGQGFLFGRGNQQISPRVLRRIGLENVILVATKNKIGRIRPRRLLVDTGDRRLDQMLHGYKRVITGYREEMILKTE